MKYLLFVLIGFFIVLALQSCLESTDNSQDLIAAEQVNLTKYLAKLKLDLKNDLKNVDDSVYQTESGLYYIIEKIGDTTSITSKEGYFLRANITWSLTDENSIIKTNDSTKLLNTKYQFSPIKGPILFYYTNSNNFFTKGLFEGIQLMHNNSKYKIIVPSNLGYGEYYIDGLFSAYSTFVYNVELINIVPDPIAEDSILKKQWVDSLELLPTDATEEKIYFRETVSGSSTESLEGKTVTVKYEMKLLDGRYISSINGDSISFYVGDTINIIRGFNKAVSLMHKGSTAITILPFEMAFGISGKYNSASQVIIPPYSSIYYKLEVTDVK
jgi:FKBP-type peptidyl-prolyl cis-trans isomerase